MPPIKLPTHRLHISLLLTFVLSPLSIASSGPSALQDPPSQETLTYFKQNCASCHTIGGGRLTGPDLKDVTVRREKSWLVKFIVDPKGVIDSGDPYAQKLLSDARGVYMSNITGMTADRAGKLVDMIQAESALEKSHFAGVEISDRPLTEEDVIVGRELFLGTRAFQEGAPACVSCHSVAGIGGLGGGRLGPDLTAAYARLEGRNALAAWLISPPSAVMQPVFTNHDLDSEEILAVVAYLKDAATGGQAEAESSTLSFVLLGLGLAALFLVAFDLIWRTRFRSVRRSLVATN